MARLAQYCNLFGKRVLCLRTDAGSVENAVDFKRQCAEIHGVDSRGIEVRPANVEKQNQNPVERHIQTVDNLIRTVMIDQDLLPSWCWGWASMAVATSRNAMSNSLVPESTPLLVMEGKSTDLTKMLRFPFGQPVVCTSTGVRVSGYAQWRNEFGVVLCPWMPYNSSCFVLLPERGNQFVALRFHVRPIHLGTRPQLSLADGHAKYLPVVGTDGLTTLVTRGDTSFLAKQKMTEMDVEVPSEPSRVGDGVRLSPSQYDSSLVLDEVLAEMEAAGDTGSQPADQDPSQPAESLQQKDSSENIERAADQSSDFGDSVDDEPRGPRRSSRSPPGVPQRYRTVAGRAYAGIVQAMVWLGMAIVMAAPAPSTAHLMTSVAVSTDAYLEKNPKWEKAVKSSASGQWLQADREERAQHQAKGTFEFVPGGRRSLPPGTMVLPIKRVCRLKDTGAFKVRWTIEGNFDPTMVRRLLQQHVRR